MGEKYHVWYSQKQAEKQSQKGHALGKTKAKLENGEIVDYTEIRKSDLKSNWPDAVELGRGEIYSIDGALQGRFRASGAPST